MLCKWEELPAFMQNDAVRPYYESLERRRGMLLVKRTFDFIMASWMLALFSPIFLAIAIWIRLDSAGPVFYRQERVTQYGRIFRIYKFRTMVQGADQKGSLVTTSGDARITRVGKSANRKFEWLSRLEICRKYELRK